jgi:ERCC4-type nuclease
MILTIDCREIKVIEEIHKLKSKYPEYSNVNLEIKQLDIGDFIFRSEEIDLLVIERKTIPDLISSIKDKRYEEQSLRLTNLEIPNHNIVYLLEGGLTTDQSINKIFISSIFSINYFKGFSVMRTFNVTETAYFLCQYFIKFIKSTEKKPFYNNNSSEIINKEYGSVIKKVKKDNLNLENMESIMLSQIPNVSYSIAKIIMDKFTSLSCLIKALEQDRNALTNLSYTDSKGKTRRVNKTSLQNILKFLIK